jgi:riboflavin kinase/FMN adenylyltransferase
MIMFDLAHPIPENAKNAVIVIGNFDAVHCGHQMLIKTAQEFAASQKLPLAVLTFEPHPRRVFRADDPPFRVTPLPVKLERLETLDVDHVYVCPFNWDIAGLSADDFIQKILKDTLSPAHIFIGADFHFGQHRTGNAATLIAAGLPTTTVTLKDDGHHSAISASRIRSAIQGGYIAEANELLGWEWFIEGVVEHGNKRGREIGYPTANVQLCETIHPSYGIYATMVQIEGENIWRPAATNIGIRPMFKVETGLVEAFLFDYTGALYGKTIRVKPIQKIRDEMKFNSLNELITQMDKDCAEIRKICAAQ